MYEISGQWIFVLQSVPILPQKYLLHSTATERITNHLSQQSSYKAHSMQQYLDIKSLKMSRITYHVYFSFAYIYQYVASKVNYTKNVMY